VTLRGIFFGPNGLRAGWRLAFFIAIVCVLLRASSLVVNSLLHGLDSGVLWLIMEFMAFLDYLVASWIVGKFEKRTLADYGLPRRQMFQRRFWQGAAIGFVSISVLIGAMAALGILRFGGTTLSGGAIAQWAITYAIVFLIVSLKEEFSVRGYGLYTLSTGIGFWPAAVATSVYFGYIHRGNSGESWVGLMNAGLIGLLFCFMLLRTGDLWLPIGFHAAWDWGESYFYGVADSGQTVPGHLLQTSIAGPAWLSGGSVGPEGSWLCSILIVAVWVIFSRMHRENRYPAQASTRRQ